MEAEVAWVPKRGRDVPCEVANPVPRIFLRHQDVSRPTVPGSGPRFVRPHKQEGEVRFASRQNFLQWPLQ